jgi:anti-sigma factor RsiW
MNLKPSPKHATWAELADLADVRTNATARTRLEAHLAACPSCAGRLAALTKVTGIMRSDRTPEPPADVVARAVRSFQPETLAARARTWLAGAVEVIGRLVFDSLEQPSFAAARGVISGRRLRFEAAGLELDLLAERREGKGHLTGQVIKIEGDARPVAGARFLVLTGGEFAAEGATDAIGEFTAVVDRMDEARVVVMDGEHAVTFPLPSNLDV